MNGPASGERIVAHLAFARAVASRSLDPRCRGADREDLIAWGVLGLVQAARRYRGDLGAPFGAYAARRVRGQVLDALRERDPLTRTERRAFREAQKVSEDLPPPYVEISLERLGARRRRRRDGGLAGAPSRPALVRRHRGAPAARADRAPRACPRIRTRADAAGDRRARRPFGIGHLPRPGPRPP